MSTPLTDHCISGVKHEGEPIGRVEKIGGRDVYVGIPTKPFPKEKAVLFLPDVFGIQLVNNKLLIDGFAENGVQTYGVDYFEGDPFPEDAMNDKTFDRGAWGKRHPPPVIRKIIDDVIAGLKESGVTVFAAVGYCFGARYVMDLAQENAIVGGVFTHPSRLVVPHDLEVLLEASNVPVLFNTCEVDQAFPLESQKITDELLGDGKYKPGYKRTYWEGCSHGYAVRGDLSNPKVKEGKEGTFKATAEFFLQYLS